MDTELMTPFLDLLNPLSEVTIASLKDLGYGVDLSQGGQLLPPVRLSTPTGCPGCTGSAGHDRPRQRHMGRTAIRHRQERTDAGDPPVIRVVCAFEWVSS